MWTEDRGQKTEDRGREKNQICITSNLEGMQSNRKKNISDIRNTNMKLRINKDQSLLRGGKKMENKKREELTRVKFYKDTNKVKNEKKEGKYRK